METKNLIISDLSADLYDASMQVLNKASRLSDNYEENVSTIKTLNILLETVRSQTVILQQAIDKYGE